MLFSKIKKKGKKGIKIFGIKIFYKKDKNYIPTITKDFSIYDYLVECWQVPRQNDFSALYQRLGIMLCVQDQKVIYSEQYRRVLLCLIQSYLEDRSYGCAVPLLRGYIKHFGPRDIEYYLPVSEKLSRIVDCDQKVLRSAAYYKKILRGDELLKLVAGKSVAVVGNGPGEIGKGKGEEIDGHDLVIRFNAYKMDDEIKKDYGTKTDIWYLAFSPVYDLKKDLDHLKMIVVGGDIFHSEFKYGYLDFLDELTAFYDVPLFSVDSEYRKKLREETRIMYLSSGFILLKYLLDNRDIMSKVSVYGFTMNNEKNENDLYQRYFERRDEIFMGHNFSKEAEILKNMINLGEI